MQASSAILRPSCYQPVPRDVYILNRNEYYSVFQQAHQAKRRGHRCHLKLTICRSQLAEQPTHLCYQ